MENNIFINEGISNLLKKYLDSKDNPQSVNCNSFFSIIVQTLIFIYGELDILNPYQTNNPSGLSTNLTKYGFSEKLYNEFIEQILIFYKNENKSSFLNIQKRLIDMFISKKNHILVSDEEIEIFKQFLYLKEDSNETKKVLYNKLTPNSEEISHYLNSKLFEQKHKFTLTEYKDIALSKDAYQIAGFNPVEIMNMSEKEIENINNKVYHFFRIRDNDLNKRNRLESAIDYYKKYGNTITSGKGYVDSLLLSGFIATGFMILTIIAIKLLG